MTKFVSNREIYEQVIRDRVPLAKRRLWIATADIKDMYVDSSGRDMVPFLKVLATLIGKGVEVRLSHAKEPGPNFREDFDRYPRLFTQMERVLCPRVHFKCVIVDGTFVWFGSANLTGAGMARSRSASATSRTGLSRTIRRSSRRWKTSSMPSGAAISARTAIARTSAAIR